MLVDADQQTAEKWKEQTRINTLGYMEIATDHYKRLIDRKTEEIPIGHYYLQMIDTLLDQQPNNVRL